MHRWISTVLLAAGMTFASFASAQGAPWPTKPIRVVVPFPAGGQLDVVTRLVTDRLSTVLGQPIVIEVRTGADGNIGTDAVAKAVPDGYTWLAVSPPTTIQPSVRPKTLTYDPLRDFEPVAFLGTSPFLFIVPADLPVRTLQDFAAYAKSQPGKLSYGGSARGTVVHLATELYMHEGGLRMEMINYPGQPQAMVDLMASRLHFMTLGLVLAEPQIKAGKLKALAILDKKRHARLPDVPTVVELGMPQLVMTTWFGIAMPARTPAPIVQRVNAELNKILQAPDIVQKLQGMGVDPASPNSPADFANFMRSDVARWKQVVRDAGIQTD